MAGDHSGIISNVLLFSDKKYDGELYEISNDNR